MAVQEVPVSGHLTGTGVQELRNLRFWQRTVDTGVSTEGVFWFNSNSGDKRLKFWDATAGSAIVVPRLDRAEQWTARPGFTSSGAPFTVTSTTRVDNLNSHYLADSGGTGRLASTTAIANTVALRDASGRVTGEDPTSPTDLVNLRFLRAELRGADDKGSVKAAFVTAIPAHTFTGNRITASANGAIAAADGVTLAVGDIVALLYEGGGGNNYYKGSQNALNGLWEVIQLGDASNPFILERADVADVTGEVSAGMYFFVDQGTQLKNSVWALMTDDPVYLRTDCPNGLSAVIASGGTLTASTTYYYRVTIVDSYGKESATSLETSATTDTTNKTINISWTTYSEASSYRIYRSTSAGSYGATSLAGTATTGTFSDNGVTLTSGTPPTASALEFAKIASNAFYQEGNGISVAGDIISVKVNGGTTFVANALMYASSTTALAMSANLTWNGSTLAATGTGSFTVATNDNHIFSVTNTTSGTGARTFVRNVAGTTTSDFVSYSQGYTTSGDRNIASSCAMVTDGSGGLTLGTIGSAVIRFITADTKKWEITTAGILQANGAQTIQSSSGILTVTGTGGLTLSTAANTNILLSPNGTGKVGINEASPSGKLHISGTTLIDLWMSDTAAALDTKNWSWQAGSAIGTGILRLRALNDANSNGINAIEFNRTGISSVITTFAGGDVRISSLTQKSVLFAGASGAVSQENSVLQYLTTADGGPGFAVGDTAQSGIAGYFVKSGAKTTAQYAGYFFNSSTSSTASIDKYGLRIQSTGTWNGSSANHYGLFIVAQGASGTSGVNYGIYISDVSTGTTNWALYNNTAANVYLGTGNVGFRATAPRASAEIWGIRGAPTPLATAVVAGSNGTLILGDSTDTGTVGTIIGASLNGSSYDTYIQVRNMGAASVAYNLLLQPLGGKVGIATTSPSYDLSFGGNAARTMALERHTTADTAGSAFTITAGGATSGATNKAGGTLFLRGGQNTGSGGSTIEFYTCAAGGTSTTDGTQTLRMSINNAGTVNITSLTASMLVQTDGSKNLVSSNTLPAGTLGTISATTAPVALIQWFNVGDGSSTSITLTHNFNTRDVAVHIYENAAGDNYKTNPLVPITRPTVNTVVLEFITAPTSNQYRACVMVGI